MTINTQTGRTYAVTSTAGCTVTDANGLTLCTVDAGTQGYFVATGNTATVTGDDAAAVTLLFNAALRKLRMLAGGSKLLPSGYTTISYLESPGTADSTANAYFSLPINATPGVDDLKIQTQHFFPVAPTRAQIEGGGVNRCYLSTLGLSVIYDPPKVFISFDGVTNSLDGGAYSDVNLFSDATFGVWQTYETHRGLSSISLMENGIIKTSFTPIWGSNLPATTAMGVFGRLALDGYSFFSLFGRKKTYKLWVNNELKHDLVPCVNPNGEVCFYNLIAKAYIANSGTVPFIAGIDSTAQIKTLLRNLPDLTGQEAKTLQIRLADSIRTEEMEAYITAQGTAKNWLISHAA